MKKVLIVIDMQKDFIHGSLGSPQAQAIIPKVIEKIKEYKRSGSEIIFTRDTHAENYLETQEGINLPVPHCIENTEGWELSKEIASAAGMDSCKVINKGTFGSTDLAEQLSAEYMRNNGYNEIELVGLVSSICVISNALILKAHLPEIKITVDASCTAGITEEDYKASLCVMKMCQINVINERV